VVGAALSKELTVLLEYTVTAQFEDPAVFDEYVAWLTHGHLAQVIEGGALEARLVKLSASSLQVHYLFSSAEHFARYEAGPAVALRADGAARFPPSRGVKQTRSQGELLALVAR
jgi:hypothetical protein